MINTFARIFGFIILMTFCIAILAREIDGIVAIVNEGVVLESELERAYRVAQLRTANSRNVSRQEVLESLVLRRIQLDLAKRLNIYISDEEQENQVRRLLAEQRLTREGYERILLGQGISYAQWRQDVVDGLILRELQNRQLRRYIQISQKEIDDYIIDNLPPMLRQTRYAIAHCLIPSTEVANIESILTEISSITDKEKIADICSSYPDALVNYFNDRTLTDLPQLFIDHLPLLDEGELRSFREGSSWHIIKAMEVVYPQPLYRTEYRLKSIALLRNVLYTDEQLRVRMDSLYERLRAGEDFSDLAQTFSSRNDLLNNYELDWVNEDILPSLVRDRIENLAVGDFSFPFFMDNGWYIVLVENKRRRDVTLDRIMERAYGIIANRKLNLSLPFWLNDIRSQAYVEYRL